MEEVILIGYFKEVTELCEKCDCSIIGVVDSEPKGPYPYLGDDEEFIARRSEFNDIPLVLTPDKPNIREELYRKYKALGFEFKTLIAPEAIVSKSAKIAEGCMIQSLCNVSSDVDLGKCVRVNTGANIMHNAVVRAFSVIAPSAVLLGHVMIGNLSYIGANSTILPYIEIEDNVTVGAGAVVTRNVNKGAVVAGVPAKLLFKERMQ